MLFWREGNNFLICFRLNILSKFCSKITDKPGKNSEKYTVIVLTPLIPSPIQMTSDRHCIAL